MKRDLMVKRKGKKGNHIITNRKIKNKFIIFIKGGKKKKMKIIVKKVIGKEIKTPKLKSNSKSKELIR